LSYIHKFIFIFFIAPVASFALQSEFDVHYRLGVSDLSLSHAPGIAFAVYPWNHFGFSAGLDYSIRTKTNTGEQAEVSRTIIDQNGDNIEFIYRFDKYREKLWANTFQIPILLKLRWDYFYFAAGLKIGLPQNMTADFSFDNLRTEGCITEWAVCFDDLAEMGFGVQEDSAITTKIKSKTVYMLAAESGVKIKFSNSFAIALGAYADYSINKGFKRDLPAAVEWVEISEEKAEIKTNDNWKSWQPWSFGGDAKLVFSTSNTMVTTGLSILIFDIIVAIMMFR